MTVEQLERPRTFESMYALEEEYQLAPKLLEQLPLSFANEQFGLELREYIDNGELRHEATLEYPEHGDQEPGSVTIPIPAELYAYYRAAELPAEAPVLDPSQIVHDILARLQQGSPATIHIGGRSGSGKSTIVRQVREGLDAQGISSCVLSTDDYHRGTAWLVEHNGGQPWTHWDEPVVYDTIGMAEELAKLQAGQPIERREIDWSVCEPHVTGVIEPSDVILIEGIYARSPDITSGDDLVYEMPTPLATCIGRRLLRDMRERPEFADPVKSLAYMLAEAEPAYLRQQNS